MQDQVVRIVVLGAGYAGLLATTRMAGKLASEIRMGRVSVTLVNASDVFVERLRLHQAAAGRPPVARSIGAILSGSEVGFVHGAVKALDPDKHAVSIQVETPAQTRTIEYDILVYALGSETALKAIPGVSEHAFALTAAGERSVSALRTALVAQNASPNAGRLLVCGAGPTGIEAAAEFAQAYPNLRVQLITRGAFGGFTKPGIADYMRRSLTKLGVTMTDHTAITAVGPSAATTDQGETVPFDLCLWTGGFSAPALALEAGLAVNDRGQIVIDPFMRSISHPDIYAVGDAASPREKPGAAVRMAALTAAFMGAHGANCVIAAVKHTRPKPFSFAYVGQAISLGMSDAIGFNNFPNDIPHPPYFTGKLGYNMRDFFVRLLADLPSIERRIPGALQWPGAGRYTAAQKRSRRGMTTHARQSES